MLFLLIISIGIDIQSIQMVYDCENGDNTINGAEAEMTLMMMMMMIPCTTLRSQMLQVLLVVMIFCI